MPAPVIKSAQQKAIFSGENSADNQCLLLTKMMKSGFLVLSDFESELTKGVLSSD